MCISEATTFLGDRLDRSTEVLINQSLWKHDLPGKPTRDRLAHQRPSAQVSEDTGRPYINLLCRIRIHTFFLSVLNAIRSTFRSLPDILVSAASFLTYDYLLNFNREVTLIWYSPWTYTKVLYFIVRYLPFIDIVFLLRFQLVLGLTKDDCGWIFPAVSWLTTVSTFSAEGKHLSSTSLPIIVSEHILAVIMMIRTWAVWQRDKRIAAVFGALCCAYIGLAVSGNIGFVNSIILADPPYPGFRGCLVLGAANSLTNTYITLVVMEFLRKGGIGNRLSQIIHRDVGSIMNYVVTPFSHLLLLVQLLIIGLLWTQLDLHFSFVPVCMALYSSLTTRVLLNIREVARGGRSLESGATTQLHDYTLPLAFHSRTQDTTTTETK
ncbi:uncharacterized protein LACBIDRAFT_327780 [Laccaria bicolor S238N-H82]|uniref:Predicted protein n=1 Tax=Laccaria bicolor (strain S238N-H82 / ATCC MYA-4686) TaxID=486041 RepID=B0DCT6_LACBS|nr:uncharacterized protein LACBIDRAFT_327780 [Laccaria bicolor S238N-H82]EDR07349.1 predicted protein [Laccaria bicolor S238N-H82]|eukprot:XP_001881741.1 predicted protein [Laccaria bicolor S238N-H82]